MNLVEAHLLQAYYEPCHHRGGDLGSDYSFSGLV